MLGEQTTRRAYAGRIVDDIQRRGQTRLLGQADRCKGALGAEVLVIGHRRPLQGPGQFARS